MFTNIQVGCAIGQTKPTAPFTLKTQLIAHDKPVHDIEFAKINGGRDHFATVGESCLASICIFL